ncbi:hypothetical protein AGMMS49957_15360 [Synergistales bacterium]|nr:hypothetical protein AGMMS49957_15360 [Synergistales bacterium]
MSEELEQAENNIELTENVTAGENSYGVSGLEKWERAGRVREIKALNPVNAEVGTPLDKKSAESVVREFGPMENEHDGRVALLPMATVGKILKHQEFDVSTILRDIPTLFKTSIRAWSESEVLKEGHKEHPNIAAFHHYVNKFTDGADTYFIRFAIRESKTKNGKPGENNIHSTAISDMNTYKNDDDSQRIRIVGPGEDNSSSFIDTRLQEFFDSVNSGSSQSAPTINPVLGSPPLSEGNYNTGDAIYNKNPA